MSADRFTLTYGIKFKTHYAENTERITSEKGGITLVQTINPKFFQSVDSIQKDFALAHRDIVNIQRGQPIRQRVKRAAKNYNINSTNLCTQYNNNVWANTLFFFIQATSL